MPIPFSSPSFPPVPSLYLLYTPHELLRKGKASHGKSKGPFSLHCGQRANIKLRDHASCIVARREEISNWKCQLHMW